MTEKLRKSQSLELHIPDFRRVAITLVGCGGTGSHIASGLVAIAQALAERDIAVDLCFIDDDIVEPKNVGRQLFSLADLGRPKAEVLAERLNQAFGTRAGAEVRRIDALDSFLNLSLGPENLNLVVGAVDNAAARGLLARAVLKADGRLWWVDSGNSNHTGQVAIGNTASAKAFKGAVSLGLIDRLPAPHLVYPDLVRSRRPRRPAKAPSCAELTAAGEQSLMVNRMLAAWTCSLLYDFLVTRKVCYFALAVDLKYGGTRPYALDVPTLAGALGMPSDQLVAGSKTVRQHRR